MPDNPRILWEGPQLTNSSLGLVNRYLCAELIKNSDFEVTLLPSQRDSMPAEWIESWEFIREHYGTMKDLRDTDVHVIQQWPPSFRSSLAKKYVMFQPWEYGTIPKPWVPMILRNIDEVWVNSDYTKQGYVRSGIPEHKIFVFPLGIDPNVYNMNGPRYELPTARDFKFLFVGGTIYRKGIDKLLEAYVSTFSRQDNVTLVIKDVGNKTYYQGQTHEELIKQLMASPDNPEIIYIDQELSADELAALYRSCDCLVHPYRGEGFGLPILEAMACGLMPIIPGQGPAAEFTSIETSMRVQSNRVSVNLPHIDTVLPAELIEIDAKLLGDSMRMAVVNRNDTRNRGLLAGEYALANHTWSRIGSLVKDRLEYLMTSIRETVDQDELQKRQLEYIIRHTLQESRTNKNELYSVLVKSFNAKTEVLDLNVSSDLWIQRLQSAGISVTALSLINPNLPNPISVNWELLSSYLERDAFDGISLMNVIEFLEPYEVLKLLQILVNEMSYQGRLLITTMNNVSAMSAHPSTWTKLVTPRPYSVELIQSMLLELGFRTVVVGKSPDEQDHIVFASLLSDDNPFAS